VTWRFPSVHLNSTHIQSVELGKVQGRASFYFWGKTKSGLNHGRSSLTEIDKWSELDCENRSLYTQNFGEVLKGVFHTISRSRHNHATSHSLITPSPHVQRVTWLGRDRKWEQERYLNVIRVRAEWGYVHVQYAVHACFLLLGWFRFLCLLSVGGDSSLLDCWVLFYFVILYFRCSRLYVCYKFVTAKISGKSVETRE